MRHARSAGFFVFASLLLALASPAAVSAADGVTPAPAAHRWGLGHGFIVSGAAPVDGQLAPDDILLQARAAGFGWVRYILFWHLANPAQSVFDWTQSDHEIARLRAAGFNVLVQVMYPPSWTTASPYPNEAAAVYCLNDPSGTAVKDVPECTQADYRPGARAPYRATSYPPGYDRTGDFREFLTAAVQRYRGVVQAWASGVESHTPVFWRGSTDQLIEEVLRPTYEIVKREDPAALVVGPDEDVEDFFEYVLKKEAESVAAGRGLLFDVLAYHTHNHSGYSSPSRLETGYLREGGFSNGTEENARCSFTPAITANVTAANACSITNILARYRRGRPFWLTEMGFRYSPMVTQAADDAKAWTDRWIPGVQQRPWIDKAFLIMLRHDLVVPPGDFGLYYNDGSATPTPVVTTIVNRLATQATPAFSYLAEGNTSFFDMDVSVANPNATAAPVKVSFLKPDGSVELVTEVLAAMSRKTYRVQQLPGLPSLSSTDVSTVVESTLGLPLATERTMFWDKSSYYGGHGGTAVTSASTTWYFAEGYQGYFDTYLLLANSGNVDANVTVTYLREGGLPPISYPVRVKATARTTVWAGEVDNGALLNQSFAMRVESDQPVIAERAMYFGAVPFWYGGHESAGVPALAQEWFLAEGRTGSFFDEYVLVGNPGDQPATVTFTFLLESGQTVVGTAHVGAASRMTLPVAETGSYLTNIIGNAALLADAAVSVRVTADVPIVVERAMYWPKTDTGWAEAHNSFGITETGTRWALAEGRVGRGRGFDTYILLANPGDEDAVVTITYLRANGQAPVVQVVDVPATSRRNAVPQWDASMLAPGGTSLLADEEFGALIESTVPIVVERAMYWDGPGAPFWAGGTNATATKLP